MLIYYLDFYRWPLEARTTIHQAVPCQRARPARATPAWLSVQAFHPKAFMLSDATLEMKYVFTPLKDNLLIFNSSWVSSLERKPLSNFLFTRVVGHSIITRSIRTTSTLSVYTSTSFRRSDRKTQRYNYLSLPPSTANHPPVAST